MVDTNSVRKTSEKLPVRDPFILAQNGVYYLYKTFFFDGVKCFTSTDLENWSDPVTVLSVEEAPQAVGDVFWAPECHYYNGSYYIFTSVFSSDINHHSISVYKSESPLGPFKDIANGCITPKDWDAIDGTLYIDENGTPFMVFVHEWISMPNKIGSMVYAELSPDFTRFVSTPKHMFYANEPSWATLGVTDGPFLFKTSNGELNMLWSNFSDKGYVLAVAKSASGKLEGPWIHNEKPIYQKGLKEQFTLDGGHGMIFTDFNGVKRITFHSPNHNDENVYEHLKILPLSDLINL